MPLGRVRIGIVGAGYAGNVHAENLSRNPSVELRAICESRPDDARLFSNRYGTKIYSDYRELLSDTEIDAVYITTPNYLHAQQAIAAMEKGKDVFSEKPMATSLGEAKDVLNVAGKAGVKYQIGLSRRFWPVYKYVKGLIGGGALNPYLADIKMSRGELKRPSWVSDEKVSGGFLYESVLHILDLVRWLMGDIETVYCEAKSSIYKQLDDFAIILKTADRKMASITSSAHATWVFPFERVELYGDHSCVITEEMARVTYSRGLEKEVEIRDFSQLPRNRSWGFEEEDGLFVDSILSDSKIAVDEVEAYKSIELVEACYGSARIGGPMRLPL